MRKNEQENTKAGRDRRQLATGGSVDITWPNFCESHPIDRRYEINILPLAVQFWSPEY